MSVVEPDSPAHNTRSRTRARRESDGSSSPSPSPAASVPPAAQPSPASQDGGLNLLFVKIIRVLMVITNTHQLLLVILPLFMQSWAWVEFIPRIATGACVVYWGVAEQVFRTKKGKNRLSETPHDRGTSVVCSFCVIFLHNLPLIMLWLQGSGKSMHALPATFKQFHTQPAWYALPLFVACSALALRWLSIYTLGDFFSRALAIFDGHQIVDTGIYSMIRHPGYLANLLLFASTGLLISANLLLFFLIIVIFFLAWHFRINVEEDMLIKAKEQAYKDYQKRVPARLIPGIY